MRVLSCLAVLLSLACVRDVHAAAPQDLRVFAAAGLTAACKELGPLFEQAHPGIALVWNFAASGALLQQLEQGAPAEVFLSADQHSIDRATAAGLTSPGSGGVFARDVVVLAAPAGNRAGVRSVADLFGASVEHVGLGDPASTPLGAYVRDAFSQEDWARLLPKFVFGQTMPQVVSWLKRGEVEAALVFRSGVRQANQGQGNGGPAVVELELFPTPKPVVFVAALTTSATRAGRQDAVAMVDFLSTPAAQAILERHGFLLP